MIERQAPDIPRIELIAAATTFIAMKASSSSKANFSRLDKLLASLVVQVEFTITKANIIDLETVILKELEFNLDFTNPYFYLDRFQHLTSLDIEECAFSVQVDDLARNCLLSSLYEPSILNVRPS